MEDKPRWVSWCLGSTSTGVTGDKTFGELGFVWNKAAQSIREGGGGLVSTPTCFNIYLIPWYVIGSNSCIYSKVVRATHRIGLRSCLGDKLLGV